MTTTKHTLSAQTKAVQKLVAEMPKTRPMQSRIALALKKVAKAKAERAGSRKPAAAAKKELPKVAPVREKMTKAQLADHIAYEAQVDRKTVLTILNTLNSTVAGAMKKGTGCGEFTIPGLLKLSTKKVPARTVKAIPAGTVMTNMRTGEEYEHQGRAAYRKPATVKIKVRPLATLKRYAVGA